MKIKWEDLQIGVASITHSFKDATLQADISKHNATFYLKDEKGYRDIWLVKRPI